MSSLLMQFWDPQSIPEIKEITIYYSDMINGIKVQYRKCGKFKLKQPASAKTKKKTLKLRKGEWINKVLGMAEDYVYQLELRTNLGQSLIVGKEKGEWREPDLPLHQDLCYIPGFNFYWGE